MNEEELNGLTYRQLQKQAKQYGVKANLPKKSLIAAILEAKSEGKETVSKTAENGVDSSDEIDASETSTASSIAPTEEPKESEKEKVESATEKITSPLAKTENASTKDESVELLFVDEPKAEKPMDVDSEAAKPSRDSLASIPPSRRNSRLSRLFDKEAFDKEAAKVSRLAQQVLDSPRRRSSILNLTPVGKNQTASAINSPLVAPTPKSGNVDSPLAKPLSSIKSVASKPTTSPLLKSAVKATPLNKRPSLTKSAAKTTPFNKRPSLSKTATKTNTTAKKVTLKADLVKTPGSITKAKDRLATGIPRPRKVPDFAKMHAKQFSKMDTLNEYLDKKKERMAAMTPGAKKQAQSNTKPAAQATRKSPRNLNIVTDLAKTSFNFTKKDTTAKTNPTTTASTSKPFVFSATKKTEPLDNITNKNDSKYKPHLGKIKPWNPKERQLEKQKMANRALGGEGVKKKQMSVIKGVRLNKRTELMLQKRKINN